jgi:hypothetical protein
MSRPSAGADLVPPMLPEDHASATSLRRRADRRLTVIGLAVVTMVALQFINGQTTGPAATASPRW